MTKVVVWRGMGTPRIVEGLAGRPEVETVLVTSEAEAVRAVGDAEVFVLPDARYTPALAASVKAARRLKWLALTSAGFDKLRGIGAPEGLALTNAAAAWSLAVAEHAVLLTLALRRRLPAAMSAQRNGVWDRGYAADAAGLGGARLLIVGFGGIGREVARLARPFGASVTGVARSAREDPLAERVVPLEALFDELPGADAVICALPYKEDLRGLIGKAELERMQPRSVLVNVARGALVETGALAEALSAGMIAGAGLDVTDPEPLPEGHPLWSAPNTIITPHVAGAGGPAAEQRIADAILENMHRYLAGDALVNQLSI